MLKQVYRGFSGFLSFIIAIFHNRYVIFQLAKRDFKNKYLGSYLGLPWAFLQPLVTIFVMWFVFTVGFKSGKVDEGVPFALWLICGMIPWFFINDSISNSTGALLEYSFLIKNISFRASIIPLIKIFTSLVIHLFFVFVIIVAALLYGLKPSIYWIQIFYYLFAGMVLLIGISWLVSSFMVFIRDIGQVVGVVMQLGFWATPIFWSYKMLNGKLIMIQKLNPFAYITEGYRETFIYNTWFFEHYKVTGYYWCITFIVFVAGAIAFKKLKPHFADVL
jgi:lipopolysaccharide transport system permease protein/teichoic acid transport system permease protein